MSRARSVAKTAPIIGAVLFLLVTLAASVSGDIPKRINYQGRLVDSSTGEPLAGSHSLVFRIYELASDGTPLWSETKIEEVDSNGVFSTVLGSVNPIDVVFASPLWLEIEVDGQILSPRREFLSVPSAYQASNADMLNGLSPDAFADSSVDGHSLDAVDGDPKDAVYVDDLGRVGVGTSTPTNRLDVRGPGNVYGGGGAQEVVGHFRIAGSTAHTAISIDGQAGKDASLYLAQDGFAVWDIRNRAEFGNELSVLRYRHSGGYQTRVVIDSVGNIGVVGAIGIGTYDPRVPLQVESSININDPASNFTNRIAPVAIGDGDGAAACILIDGNQIEQAKTTEKLYLNFNSPANVIIASGGGKVGIGTNSPGYKLQVGVAGDGSQARANAWNLLSSRDYKKDIEPLSPAQCQDILEKAATTDVVKYRFSNDPQAVEHLGVIAEESPAEIVASDGKGVSLGDYAAFLLAAIKAQQAEIKELTEQVKELRSEVEARH